MSLLISSGGQQGSRDGACPEQTNWPEHRQHQTKSLLHLLPAEEWHSPSYFRTAGSKANTDIAARSSGSGSSNELAELWRNAVFPENENLSEEAAAVPENSSVQVDVAPPAEEGTLTATAKLGVVFMTACSMNYKPSEVTPAPAAGVEERQTEENVEQNEEEEDGAEEGGEDEAEVHAPPAGIGFAAAEATEPAAVADR